MKTLIETIIAHAERQPEAEAIFSSGFSLSYLELLGCVRSVAGELNSLRVRRLGLYTGNSLEWVLLDLAAAYLDIPVVPIPLFFSFDQRQHLLDNSQVDAVFTSQSLPLERGRAVESSLLAGKFVMTGASPQSTVGFSKITYTSGSTGTPKGVCLSANVMTSIADSLAQALQPSNLGRHLCLLPFATLLENVAGIYLPLLMGRSLVIEDCERIGLLSNHSFDPQRFASAVQRYDIHSVILLPQMLKSIIEAGLSEKLVSLKFIAVGGGKVAPDLLESAVAQGLPVFEGYGLTECGSCVALNTPAHCRLGSVGKPLSHAGVRITDSGEVYVSGAAMEGYIGDATAVSEIATGDAGFIDHDGYLYITGRIKNTIISSFGRNISPEWVESQFLAESCIQQIAVFGEAQPHLAAVIQPAAGVGARAIGRVIERINRELPDYARLGAWHCSEWAFSAENGTLTTNGKLCRDVIAAQFTDVLYPSEIA